MRAPTPMVGEKLSVNESSQKRSMREVLPTVELPSSSSLSSLVLSSPLLAIVASGMEEGQAAARPSARAGAASGGSVGAAERARLPHCATCRTGAPEPCRTAGRRGRHGNTGAAGAEPELQELFLLPHVALIETIT